MKILITGIAGFIGSNLVKELFDPDNTIIGLDKMHSYSLKNHIHSYIVLDLSDDNINDICVDVDVVIHLAGESSLDKHAGVYEKDIRLASENLINSAISNKVKKVILLSTIKVHTSSQYSKQKLYIETLLKDKTESTATDYTIIRSASVYGRGMKTNIASWLWKIKNSNMPSLPKSNAQLEMIGINDLCKCISQCLGNNETNNKTYSLSDGYKYNINEIESVAREVFHNKPSLFVCPQWVIFCGSKFGDILALFHIKFSLNSRIYNFLFHNKVSNQNHYFTDTGYTPTQNFMNEIPHIFVEPKI